MDKLYFAKVKPEAIIPSKREEDGGYDLYACFEENEMVIEPHEIKLIPTGIATAFDKKYVMALRERGSTGTKGMALRCGVIDSGYRNEIFVPINNTSDKTIIITKENIDKKTKDMIEASKKEDVETDYIRNGVKKNIEELNDEDYKKFVDNNYTFYPYSKAIAQALVLINPYLETTEINYEDLLKIESERGLGHLGSSNK